MIEVTDRWEVFIRYQEKVNKQTLARLERIERTIDASLRVGSIPASVREAWALREGEVEYERGEESDD